MEENIVSSKDLFGEQNNTITTAELFKDTPGSSLSRSAIISHNTDSDKYAQNRKATTDQGIPAAFATPANKASNMDDMLSTIKDFLGLKGKTAKHMSDPEFAKVAKDDHKPLTDLENKFNNKPWYLQVADVAKSEGQTIASLGLGATGWIPAGLSMFSFDKRSLSERAQTAKDIQESLSYTPTDPEAKEIVDSVSKLFQYPAEKGHESEAYWNKLADESKAKGNHKLSEMYRAFSFTAGFGGEAAPFLAPIAAEIGMKHIGGIVDTAKQIKSKGDPLVKEAIKDMTGDSTVQAPLAVVDDILTKAKTTPEEALTDPTAYYEQKFEGMASDTPVKADLPMPDVATLSNHITPEHIKDMSVEGIPSQNEAEALKAEEQAKTQAEGDNAVAGANSKDAETNKANPDQPKPQGLSAEMKGADETGKPLSEQTPDKTGDMFGNEKGMVDLEPAIQSAREALQKIREGNEASKYGEALRTFYTGARDYRIAETNQLRDGLKKIIPDFKDQEALSLLRDFKGKEADLAKRRAEYEKAGDKKIVSVIDRALNPSKELLKSDKRMTAYFEKHLEEGKKLGFLDSSITNEQYITHLLEPEEKVGGKGKGGIGGGKIGRNFQFAKSRKYENILDAYDNPSVKVKTMNALDAMTIYGDRHATAAATKLLTNELKNTEMGKWGFRTSDKIPREWVELSPGRELFRNRIPYIDKETGEAAIATQNLYVPEKVADALKPIIDPASIANVPGFKKGRMYQAYIKGVELGLSVFHMKALNITALNNAKLSSMVKSFASDMGSPEFTGEELDLIKHGGTTSVLGRTIEAYKAAQPSTFPSRMDMIRNLPGIKQADKAAQFLTHETFDVVQRKFKVMGYALQKAQWMAKHPAADALSLTEAKRSIAKEINAAFGGLHWENMGMNKNTLELSRALMLAPDWTFSNVVNAKYSFEGGPGGKAARKFWIKSAVTGCLLTQAMSMAVSGKYSNHATEVYLGKDKNGEDVYSNTFFAGAPKDATTLFENIRQFGAIEGLAHSIASKLGPLARTGMELATNKDWMGKDITTKGAGFGKNTMRAAGEIASNLAPVPFSVSNIAKMITDPNDKEGFWDYLSVLGGTPPRHMSDARSNIYDLERKNDQDQMEQSKMKSAIVNAFRKNKPLAPDQRKAYNAMTEAQKKNIDKESEMTPLQVAFSHLSPAKVDQVWNKLSAKEKMELGEIYEKKIENEANKE
jgi:hypothetical protein